MVFTSALLKNSWTLGSYGPCDGLRKGGKCVLYVGMEMMSDQKNVCKVMNGLSQSYSTDGNDSLEKEPLKERIGHIIRLKMKCDFYNKKDRHEIIVHIHFKE